MSIYYYNLSYDLCQVLFISNFSRTMCWKIVMFVPRHPRALGDSFGIGVEGCDLPASIDREFQSKNLFTRISTSPKGNIPYTWPRSLAGPFDASSLAPLLRRRRRIFLPLACHRGRSRLRKVGVEVENSSRDSDSRQVPQKFCTSKDWESREREIQRIRHYIKDRYKLPKWIVRFSATALFISTLPLFTSNRQKSGGASVPRSFYSQKCLAIRKIFRRLGHRAKHVYVNKRERNVFSRLLSAKELARVRMCLRDADSSDER